MGSLIVKRMPFLNSAWPKTLKSIYKMTFYHFLYFCPSHPLPYFSVLFKRSNCIITNDLFNVQNMFQIQIYSFRILCKMFNNFLIERGVRGGGRKSENSKKCQTIITYINFKGFDRVDFKSGVNLKFMAHSLSPIMDPQNS